MQVKCSRVKVPACKGVRLLRRSGANALACKEVHVQKRSQVKLFAWKGILLWKRQFSLTFSVGTNHALKHLVTVFVLILNKKKK